MLQAEQLRHNHSDLHQHMAITLHLRWQSDPAAWSCACKPDACSCAARSAFSAASLVAASPFTATCAQLCVLSYGTHHQRTFLTKEFAMWQKLSCSCSGSGST